MDTYFFPFMDYRALHRLPTLLVGETLGDQERFRSRLYDDDICKAVALTVGSYYTWKERRDKSAEGNLL